MCLTNDHTSKLWSIPVKHYMDFPLVSAQVYVENISINTYERIRKVDSNYDQRMFGSDDIMTRYCQIYWRDALHGDQTLSCEHCLLIFSWSNKIRYERNSYKEYNNVFRAIDHDIMGINQLWAPKVWTFSLKVIH